MRKRINRVAVASSNNYNASKKAHREMLRANHDSNLEYFNSIQVTVRHRYTRAYTMVFGNRVELTLSEAERIKCSINVIFE